MMIYFDVEIFDTFMLGFCFFFLCVQKAFSPGHFHSYPHSHSCEIVDNILLCQTLASIGSAGYGNVANTAMNAQPQRLDEYSYMTPLYPAISGKFYCICTCSPMNQALSEYVLLYFIPFVILPITLQFILPSWALRMLQNLDFFGIFILSSLLLGLLQYYRGPFREKLLYLVIWTYTHQQPPFDFSEVCLAILLTFIPICLISHPNLMCYAPY